MDTLSGKPKIGLVLPWYGLDTAGGAEAHGRRLAESLCQAGVAIEVLTSCGRDCFSRQQGNYYPEGTGEVNGVTVRRFPLRQDRGESFFRAHPDLLAGVERPGPESGHPAIDLVAEDGLFEYLQAHQEEYFFVFMPYVWGMTVWGSQLCLERSFLIPCLHDEPWAYTPIYRPVFNSVRGVLFNSGPERHLACQLYGIDAAKAAAIGEGIDLHWQGDARRFRQQFGLYDPFILFAGRRDQGKRVYTLIHYFHQYKKDRPGPLKLVLIGKNLVRMPPAFALDILDLGFLGEQEKHDAYAAATIFCQPSAVESFSIVLMEAWVQGTAALVNAECAVTADHCRRSNGGLYFRDYFEFEACLDLLLSRPALRRKMGALGREYVCQHFRWEAVVERFVEHVYGPREVPAEETSCPP